MKSLFKKRELQDFEIGHNGIIHHCYVDRFKGRMEADSSYKPELTWFDHKTDKDWCLIGLYQGKYHVTGFDFQFVDTGDVVQDFVDGKGYNIAI